MKPKLLPQQDVGEIVQVQEYLDDVYRKYREYLWLSDEPDNFTEDQ